MVTKYNLVYENLELKMFFPGQLIMSVHQRSPLSPEFEHLYKDGTSKFRRDIDNKIMKQMEPNQSMYTGMLKALNKPNENVKQNTLSNCTKEESIPNQDDDVTIERSQTDSIQPDARGSMLEIKEDDIETDSNSTDYGLQHAVSLINQKPPKELNLTQPDEEC